MNVCFWCKRPKDEGNGRPEYLDYEYCDLCTEKVNMGIAVIQITETPNGNPSIKDGLYPTGKWVVIGEEGIKTALGDWVGLEEVIKTRHMFMDEETWKKLKLPN